ncbi:hypothetical protein BMS3Abin04_02314 [bacterium BMS3Abin04]|nr:hypothetical protein BMS3Abin04_02314 [bacterium BMS3Abin04]
MNIQKTRNGKNPAVLSVGRLGVLLLWLTAAFILSGCSSSRLKVAEYEFVYNGDNYVLRSTYSPGNPESHNSLIGRNFVAVDINQDGTMDKVIKGNITLSEAQEIYDYSLGMLEKQGKLNEINKKSKEFIFNKSYYKFSIKSFSSKSGPFNEFTVVNKKPSLYSFKTSIFIDRGADGKLDEILKGGILLEKAQKMYNETISEGLKKSKLVKKEGIILVK